VYHYSHWTNVAALGHANLMNVVAGVSLDVWINNGDHLKQRQIDWSQPCMVQ